MVVKHSSSTLEVFSQDSSAFHIKPLPFHVRFQSSDEIQKKTPVTEHFPNVLLSVSRMEKKITIL